MWRCTIYSIRMNRLELYEQHKFNTTVNRIRRKGSSKSNVVSREINLVVENGDEKHFVFCYNKRQKGR